MSPRTTANPDAIVCGAGVAGMACATRLAQAGLRVAVVESRKKLGGRASSFTDPRTGEELDNCQHVALGCCTNYLDLLARLGRADALDWFDQQHWVEPGGRTSTLCPSPWLPVPAHMGPSLLRARFLSVEEVALLGVGSSHVLLAQRDRWLGRSFADFLAHADQPPSLIAKFWEPVVVSACNLSCERACAALALKVFQEGLLAGPRAARIGVPRVPLGDLYANFTPLIARAGGSVELGASVTRVSAEAVELDDAHTLRAPHVVCALPFERAMGVLDEPDDTGRLAQMRALAALGHSPILGVHLSFDRPVMHLPHAVLVGAATQWLFRKDAAGLRIHAVISGADAWMPLTEEAIVQRVLADVRAYFPMAFQSSGAFEGSGVPARLVYARAVKERRATFVAAPGVQRHRPSVAPIAMHEGGPGSHSRGSGVLLAGCYTDVGWPSTMEGATRAGYAAAGVILGESCTVPDLSPPPLLRALSRLW